ncbi:Uncharacterised protein [Fusobacterium necrophorum subsp. necrophorum]|nr:Uncharacterised protein [Fusobacterium necrophorum subsp. necrophorum]
MLDWGRNTREKIFPGWLYDEKENYIQEAYSALKI